MYCPGGTFTPQPLNNTDIEASMHPSVVSLHPGTDAVVPHLVGNAVSLHPGANAVVLHLVGNAVSLHPGADAVALVLHSVPLHLGSNAVRCDPVCAIGRCHGSTQAPGGGDGTPRPAAPIWSAIPWAIEEWDPISTLYRSNLQYIECSWHGAFLAAFCSLLTSLILLGPPW